MSKRTLVLNNFYHIGKKNATRLLKYSYAILLSDFIKKNPCKHFTDRFQMYDEVIEQFNLKDLALQYLEFGVFQGQSIKYWLSKTVNKTSRFYGFDSFEGLPEDWSPTMSKGAFNVNGKLPDIDDARVQFIKGWFNETLPDFTKDIKPNQTSQIILHLDADLYSSTYYVLNCLYFQNYIKKGTILIFDEVIVASIADTEFRAFYDFVDAMKIEYEVLGIARFEMAILIK